MAVGADSRTLPTAGGGRGPFGLCPRRTIRPNVGGPSTFAAILHPAVLVNCHGRTSISTV